MTPISSDSTGDGGVPEMSPLSIRTFGSSITRSSSSMNASMSVPGRSRQSKVASAVAGITLCFTPARAVVKLTVLLVSALISGFSSPILPIDSSVGSSAR